MISEKPLSLVGASALDPFNTGASRILEKLKDNNKKNSTNLHWKDLDDPDARTVARAICDFIAGMTNPYAEKYHRRLFEPGFGSSTDEL
ncbi:hypothetical protein [Sinorhizobium medicae]